MGLPKVRTAEKENLSCPTEKVQSIVAKIAVAVAGVALTALAIALCISSYLITSKAALICGASHPLSAFLATTALTASLVAIVAATAISAVVINFIYQNQQQVRNLVSNIANLIKPMTEQD